MTRKVLFAALLLLVTFRNASAVLLLSDGFGYNVGDNLNNQVNDANTSNTWLKPNLPGGTVQTIGAGSVDYPGLQPVTGGNAVAIPRPSNANQSFNRLNIPQHPYTRASDATLFYSFTVEMTAWTFFSPVDADTKNDAAAKNPANRRGGHIFGFHGGSASTTTNMQSPAGFAAPVYVRREIDYSQTGTDGTPGTQTERYELGIAKSVSGSLNPATTESEMVYSTDVSFGIGEKILIVGQYQFVDDLASQSPGNDVARLWINPTPGSLAAEATPTWLAPSSTNYPNLGGSLSIESIYIKADDISPGNFKIDNVRVGTTFADVIPAASTLVGGDYNHNGIVDAADYVVWRKNASGNFTQNDYNVWRANFGALVGAGNSSNVTLVPEPSALLAIALVISLAGLWRGVR